MLSVERFPLLLGLDYSIMKAILTSVRFLVQCSTKSDDLSETLDARYQP
jgi:hypothetical protein